MMEKATPAHAMSEAEKQIGLTYTLFVYWCVMAIVRCLCDIADAIRTLRD